VDGCSRLAAPVGYFDNLILWAFPTVTVGDLLDRPLCHATQAIHDAVARVDRHYNFRSFVDFASSGAVETEGLQKTVVLRDAHAVPGLGGGQLAHVPVLRARLRRGQPQLLMPSYFPTEGMLFLVPSYLGDDSVDAFVPVFEHSLEAFKQCCYNIK
jgi:shikimate O-hydroxycinnamoyltransferase